MSAEIIEEVSRKSQKKSKKAEKAKSADEVESPASEHTSQKKNRDTIADSNVPEDIELLRKKEKREKRHKDKDHADEESGKSKKKSKRREKDGEPAEGDEKVEERDIEDPINEATSKDAAFEGEKKKKKRKKRDADAGEDQDQEPVQKKKKRKNKTTDLPSPQDDTSLTDQARKALAYAFARFDDPSSWKFNKARQNWLIRNMWSDQAIPDIYLPLLTRYLSNVQGGVRENLIKACRTTLSPLPSTTTPDATAEHSEPPSVADADNASKPAPATEGVRHRRARAILDVLSASDEAPL